MLKKSLLKQFAQANFKSLALYYNSHISHNTINYCFSTAHVYLTSVSDSELIITLFRPLDQLACQSTIHTHLLSLLFVT